MSAWFGGAAERAPADSDRWPVTQGVLQPAIVSLGGKHLLLYARSIARTAHVAQSCDNRLTWTQAHPLDVPNPKLWHRRRRLKEGRIDNDTTSDRTPLNLAIS